MNELLYLLYLMMDYKPNILILIVTSIVPQQIKTHYLLNVNHSLLLYDHTMDNFDFLYI